MTDAPGLPTEFDFHRFGEGRHERLWEVLGAEVGEDSVDALLGVGAERRARSRSSATERLGPRRSPARALSTPGCGRASSPGIGSRTPYKYAITGADRRTIDRADPMAQFAEHSGGMASIVFESQHKWQDAAWMGRRGGDDPVADRMSTYEVHLGSWRRHLDGRVLTYRELAPALADHARALGFTHMELLPVAEHPTSRRGATRSPASTRQRPASAIGTTSGGSSTTSTSAASG